ncbi:hypothetical protein [Microbacterium enclense]|uniref:hypothetical protein n=1 Tax=Microbacterium enclense TaxID=993073 RepID=UPI003446262D
MATETTTVTHYGVARGEKLIGTGSTYLPDAQEALSIAEQQMIAVGLDPDVRLVEYDVETTVKAGRVRAYKEPVDETVESEPTAETAGA